MKLSSGLPFLCGLVHGKNPRSYYCDTSDLSLPANAETWDCTESTGTLVPAGNRCKLKCDAEFIETICKLILKFFSLRSIL